MMSSNLALIIIFFYSTFLYYIIWTHLERIHSLEMEQLRNNLAQQDEQQQAPVGSVLVPEEQPQLEQIETDEPILYEIIEFSRSVTNSRTEPVSRSTPILEAPTPVSSQASETSTNENEANTRPTLSQITSFNTILNSRRSGFNFRGMFGENSFENLDISNDNFFNLSDDDIYTFERRRLFETNLSTNSEALASSSQLSSSSQAEPQQLPTQELITSDAQTVTSTAEGTPKMPKRELSLNSLCRTVSIIKKVKFEPHQQESDTESSNSAEESDKEK